MRGGYDKYIGQTINRHTWRPPTLKTYLVGTPASRVHSLSGAVGR